MILMDSLPSPLVMFVTMIGYVSGINMVDGTNGTAVAGALLMTLGMFLPCFSFPVCMHDCLEKVLDAEGEL
jgi:hypothetical protein